ncbi:MAG: tyrosine--tRNA ligase [Gammaproteobacteria bacterium]|nr:tyrosine--tRNA ligase [Gammaproteobacteria bacterium]MDE0366417.1 tyrosine--tRNA ligase [Gammaproteobacteria bacterium]
MALDTLDRRGLVTQVSDRKGLEEHLAGSPRTLYCGFDPTADSLHIGSLVPLLALRRFQVEGHRPILLLGGATGLIGDPSFRDDERGLNDETVVGGWVEKIRRQVEPFLDFEGDSGAIMANNLDWTRGMDVISFLRDVGKHFSVNAMIQRDSVRNRLDRAGAGISYTEFSYMLLQANDYLELARRHGCSLQVGGSDQWGNIVSGIDLVRRRLRRDVFALTVPLITRSDGAKFGKTAEGAVWLDPVRTSPYRFYQYWLNSGDADVIKYLKFFTFLDLEEIDTLTGELREAPGKRAAQTRLAEEVTELVHGRQALRSARRITGCLFGGALEMLEQGDLEQLRLDGMDCTEVPAGRVGLLAALADAGLAGSRGAARRLVEAGGISVNGAVQEDAGRILDFSDALHGRYYLLRRGKKSWHLLDRNRAVSPT